MRERTNKLDFEINVDDEELKTAEQKWIFGDNRG